MEEEFDTGRDSRKTLKSIYARGADDGMLLGGYLTVMLGLIFGCTRMAALSIPALAMIVGVPVLTFYFLRRTHIAAHGLSVFSSLWMQGIVMFACGSLIMAAMGFIYLRWVDPSFMVDTLRQAQDIYESSAIPGGDRIAHEIELIIKAGAVPSPMNMALGWIWLGMFTGSLLSLFVALIVKALKVKD